VDVAKTCATTCDNLFLDDVADVFDGVANFAFSEAHGRLSAWGASMSACLATDTGITASPW
jgi:hypothetical protein